MASVAPSVSEILKDDRAQLWAIVLTGAVGGIQMADPVVASLALPKAGKDLDMDATALALAASVSTLFLAATVVLIGSLAERFGRRRSLLITLALSVVGDLLVVVAPVTPVFLLGRALAGVGVGGALACAYAYVRVVSPDAKLGKALGLWAALTAVLALPMQLIGAGVANANWRFAFLVIPIASVLCLAFVTRVLPLTPPGTERRQFVGVTIAGLGVVGLLYGISQAASKLVSTAVVVPILVGILLLVIAGIIGARSRRPSFPVWVFRDPGMLVAALAGAMWNLCLAVAVLQSSNLWQYVNDVAPFAVSLLQLPAIVGVVVGSFVMGRLMSGRIDFRILVFVGFLLTVVGFGGMGLAGEFALSVWFTLGITGVGLGAGAAGVAQSQVLFDAAPPGYLSPIAAARTTFGQVGYAIGLAGSVVLTSLFTISNIESSQGVSSDVARSQYNEWLTSAHMKAASHNPVVDSYTSGFSQSMFVWALVLFLGAIACVVLLSVKRAQDRRASAALG